MKRLHGFAGGRGGFIHAADHAENGLFNAIAPSGLSSSHLIESIEVGQGALNAGIAVGVKAECAGLVVLRCATTVGTTLLANGAVQIAIAQHATQYCEGC